MTLDSHEMAEENGRLIAEFGADMFELGKRAEWTAVLTGSRFEQQHKANRTRMALIIHCAARWTEIDILKTKLERMEGAIGRAATAFENTARDAKFGGKLEAEVFEEEARALRKSLE